MSSLSAKTVLLIGNYRPTIQVAAAFKKLGFRVIVSRDCGGGFAHFSRNVDECWDHPDLANEEKFFRALGDFLNARPDITCIYPIWERFQKNISSYRHYIPEHVLVISVADSTLETCVDKPKMMAFCDEANIRQGQYQLVSCTKTLASAVKQIGFPLIIRPVSSDHRLMGKKAVIAKSIKDISVILDEWPQQHDELLVQQYICGSRINLYFAASSGKAIRYLATEIEQTDETDGTGFANKGRTIELSAELKAIGDRLIEKLGYHGIGLAQFIKQTGNDRLNFVELNPRVSGSHAVPEACGMNLSELSLQLALKNEVPENLVVGRPGIRYFWTYGALKRCLKSYRSGNLGSISAAKKLIEISLSAIRADIHLAFAWNDPVPAIAEILNQAPLASSLVSRFSKSAKANSPSLAEQGLVK